MTERPAARRTRPGALLVRPGHCTARGLRPGRAPRGAGRRCRAGCAGCAAPARHVRGAARRTDAPDPSVGPCPHLDGRPGKGGQRPSYGCLPTAPATTLAAGARRAGPLPARPGAGPDGRAGARGGTPGRARAHRTSAPGPARPQPRARRGTGREPADGATPGGVAGSGTARGGEHGTPAGWAAHGLDGVPSRPRPTPAASGAARRKRGRPLAKPLFLPRCRLGGARNGEQVGRSNPSHLRPGGPPTGTPMTSGRVTVYFAALLARTEDGWEASDMELDDVESLQ